MGIAQMQTRPTDTINLPDVRNAAMFVIVAT
jgi:hypothetical protein